jgi:enoyl-CoA hydratase/carnithine racemase
MADEHDTEPEVRLTISDGVAEIVLDRPKVMNAISARPGGTRDQLRAALTTAEADQNVGCVLLRAEGKNFCGGGDLTGNARRETAGEDLLFLETADAFHDRLRASRLPVVAAVQGYCLGAGVTLASCCDFVIAGATARFAYPEGRLGLVGASAVVTTVGRQWAKFLMLTGEMISATQAAEIGLVLTVEPDDELLERARDLAGRIARMPREAVLLNRRTIDTVADAAGDAAARSAARAADTVTLSGAARATAPDGRTFRSIIDAEGMAGMKAAREAQYTEPWLR